MNNKLTHQRRAIVLLAALTVSVAGAGLAAAEEPDGFRPLFDGKTLAGWESPDMSYWSVENGAITGKITNEHPLKVNQYLVWREPLGDFELKMKFRMFGSPGVNGGFQFRSRLLPGHDMAGYQMDNNLDTPWLVRLYEEHGRETLAFRGKKAVIDADGNSAQSDIPDAGGPGSFQLERWHEYHLVCRGPHLILYVNGRLAAEVVDGDTKRQALSGLLGLQLHSGPPTTVQFKNIRLRALAPGDTLSRPTVAATLPQRRLIEDKTLVAWVTAANLTQRGGSVLTLRNLQRLVPRTAADRAGRLPPDPPPSLRAGFDDRDLHQRPIRLQLPRLRLSHRQTGPCGQWRRGQAERVNGARPRGGSGRAREGFAVKSMERLLAVHPYRPRVLSLLQWVGKLSEIGRSHMKTATVQSSSEIRV